MSLPLWAEGRMLTAQQIMRHLLPDHPVALIDGDWSKATPEQHEAARRHLAEMDRRADSRRDQQ